MLKFARIATIAGWFLLFGQNVFAEGLAHIAAGGTFTTGFFLRAVATIRVSIPVTCR